MTDEAQRANPDNNLTWKIVTDAVQLIVPEVHESEILPSASLADLGVDSVDRVEILTIAADNAGATMTLPVLAQARDLGELAVMLAGEQIRG